VQTKVPRVSNLVHQSNRFIGVFRVSVRLADAL